MFGVGWNPVCCVTGLMAFLHFNLSLAKLRLKKFLRTSSSSIVMHIGKGLSASATDTIYHNQNRCLCTHFLQPKQRTELAPTPFQHTIHGNLTDVILVLGASCLEHTTFVFPMFTLSPFTTNPSLPVL